MRRLGPPILLLVAALAGAAAPARAVAAPATTTPTTPTSTTPAPPPRTWATVNVCDTALHPDTIGVRASMPGTNSRRDAMFMRFRIQFFDPATGRWKTLSRGGDSGFILVSTGRYRSRQAGHMFRIAPMAGRSVQLRGVVTFEWRRDGRVTRREREVTAAGHRSSAGADPADYSEGVCVIA